MKRVTHARRTLRGPAPTRGLWKARARRARSALPLLFSLCASCACAGSSHQAPAPGPESAQAAAPAEAAHAERTAGSEQPALEPSAGSEQPALAELDASALHGTWVEYWALEGHAQTERYTFLPDGRYGWNAAPGGAAPARAWGRFEVQPGTLVLHLQGEDARPECDGTTSCRTQHEPALERRLTLGACPPNDEARALDARYRCLSLAGQAFWLDPRVADADSAPLAH